MFASPAPRRHPGSPFQGSLYQQVGVETGLSSASPHQLVAMLFEGWMEAAAKARGAIRSRDIPAKGQAIRQAVRIIDEGLRGGLDLTGGGTLARDLNDLYAYLTMRLTQANLRSDEAALAECVSLMKPLQEAWTAIGPSMSGRR